MKVKVTQTDTKIESLEVSNHHTRFERNRCVYVWIQTDVEVKKKKKESRKYGSLP